MIEGSAALLPGRGPGLLAETVPAKLLPGLLGSIYCDWYAVPGVTAFKLN